MDLNVKSTKLTFGVGTRIEIPSILAFNSGKTIPTAFAAPDVVGIIESAADLALRGSLWPASNMR